MRPAGGAVATPGVDSLKLNSQPKILQISIEFCQNLFKGLLI